jgi:hypothetical protein
MLPSPVECSTTSWACLVAGDRDTSSLSFYGDRLQEPTGQISQVFLSHSSEQKSGFVTFLWEQFKAAYPAVHIFMDEYALDPAGKALQNVHAALQDSFVGATTLNADCISCCKYLAFVGRIWCQQH